ncbi:nitrate/nitrite transporter NrtS [Nostoc punctiforme UO1]
MNRNRWLAGLVTYLVPYTVSIHGQRVARSKQ